MTLPEAFLSHPIAHRALHDLAVGRPENSPAAIRAAIAAGYGIEIDLQCALDGAAMVFHDYDLSRLTADSGPLAQRRSQDLGAIALTGGTEGIPTLPEVLELVAGRVPLLIEIKDQDGRLGPEIGRLEEATARALRRYIGPVAVMSFNPHSMAAMADLAPDVPRGLTTCDFSPEDWPLIPEAVRDSLRDIPDLDRVGASFVSHDARDLGADRVQHLRSAGMPVLCWTIRSPEEEAQARPCADNITFEGYLP